MYITDSSSYSVYDFIKIYQDKLPILIQVTQGYMGKCEKDTVGTGQILRLHSIKHVPCVCGKIKSEHGYTSSLYFPYFPLECTKDVFVKTKSGKLKSISYIAHRGKLPCKVTLTDEHFLHQEDNNLRLDKSDLILLEEKTSLQCILCNPVCGAELFNHVLSLPEIQQEIRLAVVLGINGFDRKQWNSFQAYMSQVVKEYIDFDRFIPLEGILSVHYDSERNKNPHYQQLYFSSRTKESEKFSYGPICQGKRSDTPDEPVYAVIPDQAYEYLAIQSFQWKQQLNTDLQLSKHKNDHKVVMTDDTAPPLPRRKSSCKSVVQELHPKLKHSGKENPGILLQELRTRQNKRLPSGFIPHDPRTEDDHDLENMTIADVSSVLRRLQLHKYVDTISQAMVDGTILKEFNDDIIQEFGFTKIESIRLMKYIQTGHVPK